MAKDTAGPEQDAGTGEDAKARFREALERKQDAAHRTAEGRGNTGPVHGAEVSGGGGRRVFRRKTG